MNQIAITIPNAEALPPSMLSNIRLRPSPRMLDLRPRTIAQVREQNRRSALCIAAVVLGLVGYAIACFFQP